MTTQQGSQFVISLKFVPPDLILSVCSKNAHTSSTGRVRSAGGWEIDPKTVGAATPSCSLIRHSSKIHNSNANQQDHATQLLHRTQCNQPPLSNLPHIRPYASRATEIYSTPPQSHRFSICNRDTHRVYRVPSRTSLQFKDSRSAFRGFLSNGYIRRISMRRPLQVKFSEPSGGTGVSCWDFLLR